MDKSTHPVEVVRTYKQVLKKSAVEGRYIEIDGGHKIHVVEAGTGPPVVMLHSTGTAAYTYLPLLERLEDVRAIAPDRPGSGLSDPFDIGHKGYRDWTVEVMDQILDALGVDQISLAGASGGGVWAIWYALAFPRTRSAAPFAYRDTGATWDLCSVTTAYGGYSHHRGSHGPHSH